MMSEGGIPYGSGLHDMRKHRVSEKLLRNAVHKFDRWREAKEVGRVLSLGKGGEGNECTGIWWRMDVVGVQGLG